MCALVEILKLIYCQITQAERHMALKVGADFGSESEADGMTPASKDKLAASDPVSAFSESPMSKT